MVNARRGIVLVDVIIGVVLLAIALATIVAIAGRAIASQVRGEQLHAAAMLLDERLNLVLMDGVEPYLNGAGLSGTGEVAFEAYAYAVNMSGGPACEASRR